MKIVYIFQDAYIIPRALHNMTNQLYRSFVELVIDPTNKTSSGKLHLDAYSFIPEDKVVDKPIPDDISTFFPIYSEFKSRGEAETVW